MKKLFSLWPVLMLVLCANVAFGQNPVTVSQAYKFQKWVSVKDSIINNGTISSGDSTHKVPNTAWVKRAIASGNTYTGSLGVKLTAHNFTLDTVYAGTKFLNKNQTAAQTIRSPLTITGGLTMTGDITTSGNIVATGSGISEFGQMIIGNTELYGTLQMRSDQSRGQIRFDNTTSAGYDYFIYQDNASVGPASLILTGNGGTIKITADNIYDSGGNQFLKSSSGGFASTVFGRSGAVVAQSGDYNTSLVTESGNLYFTQARVLATPLTGYSSAAGTLSTSDNIVQAFGKVNGNIANNTSSISSNTTNIATNTTNITTLQGQHTSDYAAIGLKQPRSLSNYIIGTNAVITTADSVTSAFGKTQAQINAANSNISTNTTSIASNTTAIAAKAASLIPTAVKTANYTAAVNDFVPVNTTSGNVTITLPTAPADKSLIGIKMVIQGGTNTVTIATGGSDVFNKTGGVTTGTLTLLSQGVLLQYNSSGGIWYVLSDDLPLSQLDLRYANLNSPTFTGNPQAPTPATADNSTSIATTAYVQANFTATTTYFTTGMFSGLGTAGSNYNWGTSTIPLSAFTATGTPSSSTYLRGDNTWATIPASVTGANPTATIGLTAVPGSATTFTRSDAAPALSQAIAPTWTALHTFSWPGIGVTPTDALLLTNTTAAGSSTPQWSPSLHFHGNYYTGSASNTTDWIIQAEAQASGSNQSLLTFKYSNNGAAYSTAAYFNPGGITTGGVLTLNQGFFGATSTDVLLIKNAAAASSGTPNQKSGAIQNFGSVWNPSGTPAANYFAFRTEASGNSATSPTAEMDWYSYVGTSTTPTFTKVASLDNLGNFTSTNTLNTKHIIGTSSAPTIAAGTGAGTSPTVTIGAGSTDIAGVINVTTGTSPTSSATVATITFNTAYGVAPNVILTPGETNSATLSGATQVRVPAKGQSGAPTTTTFQITSGSTALTASTTYVWTYHVIQ